MFFFISIGCHFLWFVLRSFRCTLWVGYFLPKLCNVILQHVQYTWWLSTINNWPINASKLHVPWNRAVLECLFVKRFVCPQIHAFGSSFLIRSYFRLTLVLRESTTLYAKSVCFFVFLNLHLFGWCPCQIFLCNTLYNCTCEFNNVCNTDCLNTIHIAL